MEKDESRGCLSGSCVRVGQHVALGHLNNFRNAIKYNIIGLRTLYGNFISR